MSTARQLAKFRSQQDLQQPVGLTPNVKFREMWADSLATIAAVTLVSILVFELVRLLVQ